ncbi:hypothetical protein JCGZ_26979 [Jatropha curcas]|uniref:Uncharacterized protein n=1 Tax=Jatropha curcas TaxID=180498 RepID=A0A067L0H0_JATCU|nr:hypothetical protein JCGZ_26979 [Jatropha curcas]
MVLPFEPHSIIFSDIKYSVDMSQEMKNQGVPEDRLELLRGVNGAFRPGVLTAVMGVSGAAWLRQSPEVNNETRKMFVEEVMQLVELALLGQALVGLPSVLIELLYLFFPSSALSVTENSYPVEMVCMGMSIHIVWASFVTVR